MVQIQFKEVPIQNYKQEEWAEHIAIPKFPKNRTEIH